MKIAFVICIVILLSGCSTTQGYKAAYMLQPQPSLSKLSGDSCRDKTLKVSQSFSSKSLMRREMSYVEGDFNEFIFSESEWSQSPNSTITQGIKESLRAAEIFKSVEGYKSRSRSDYLLESSIEDFMQYFDKELKSSYVKIVIHFSLIDAKSSAVLHTVTLSKKIETQTLDAQGGVVALNRALSQILQEQNIWMSEVCR